MAATAVALSAWAGILVQTVASYQLAKAWLPALWAMVEYFTILTNLLAALVFTAVATGRTPLQATWVVAGTMLSMTLVGLVYALLLRDTPITGTASKISNVLLHGVTPALIPLFWIFFVRKGQMNAHDVLPWTAYPLSYLGYSLVRSRFSQRYPYPFLNVPQIGWPAALRNAAAIAVIFVAASFLLIWIDHISAA